VRRGWVIIIVLVVGAALGVAIAGVPNRHADPPLRVVASSSSTIPSTPAAPAPTTTSTTPPHRASDVGVVVINAAGLAGKGTELTTRLRNSGYTTFAPENDTNDHPNVSTIEYAPGYQGDAVAISPIVGVGPVQVVSDSPVPSHLLGNANVMVIIGSDLR
jgi:hypothetical protein